MNNQASSLNFARKWRAKTFRELIGQDFSVRMLKNSLFLGKIAPLYIFSGQRGCGKTSTARIFAAALNCKERATFVQNPQKVDLPCLLCTSCEAFNDGHHPDFIEIDAASHTGVDNVRTLIESAVHMPIAGVLKVYLIDEAHMLSRAAFNAFLKMLEEPPATVRFIFATTELHKIPDTVRSRALHVFFHPLESSILRSHLLRICKDESITITPDAVEVIVAESEGSVRDALNTLERVSFVGKEITKQEILNVLGYLREEDLLTLFDCFLQQNPQKVLAFLPTISFERCDPVAMWNMLSLLCRSLLWVKLGAAPPVGMFRTHYGVLKRLTQECSLNRLNAIMRLLWSSEEIFLKTSKKHLFLESTFLTITQQVNIADLDELFDLLGYDEKKSFPAKHSSPKSAAVMRNEAGAVKQDREPVVPPSSVVTVLGNEPSNEIDSLWAAMVKKIGALKDPILYSIFQQARPLGIAAEAGILRISLANDNRFFQQTLREKKEVITTIAREVFKGCKDIAVATPQKKTEEGGVALSEPKEVAKDPSPMKGAEKASVDAREKKLIHVQKGRRSFHGVVDISDQQKWPKANLLATYFPGRVKRSSDS